jgi:hypothetical protein
MRVFRSGDEIEEWCRLNAMEPGAIVPLGRLQRLAELWYGDRLEPGWRPRTVQESQRVLEAAGLTGPFWRLAGPAPTA